MSRTITAAIPAVFEAYATVALPQGGEGQDRHDGVVLALLSEQSPTQPWWLGYLDIGADERPPWGYSRLVAVRMATVSTALDLDTGGGEVLVGLGCWPWHLVATESWPSNVSRAAGLLGPRGGWVIATGEDDPALPFRPGVFDLVVGRHPVDTWWEEVARVLRPGGMFLAQEIGQDSNAELHEAIAGPLPPGEKRSPQGPGSWPRTRA